MSVLKMTKLLVAVFLLSLSTLGLAQGKYGVVDIRAALFASKSAKEFSEQLKNDFKDDEQKIKQLGKEAQALQDRLKKDGALMSDAERSKIAEEFDGKAKEFNFQKNKFEEAVNKRKQAFLFQSKPKVDKAILKVAKDNGLDILFPKEATLWVAPSLDMTAKVIEELNK